MNVEILKKQISLVKSSGNRYMRILAENVEVSMYHAEKFVYAPNGYDFKEEYYIFANVEDNDTLVLESHSRRHKTVFINVSNITSIQVIDK